MGGTNRRQVELHTDEYNESEQTLTGVYTETVWGPAPQPLTIAGEFTLLRHSYQGFIVPRLFLPVVVRH